MLRCRRKRWKARRINGMRQAAYVVSGEGPARRIFLNETAITQLERAGFSMGKESGMIHSVLRAFEDTPSNPRSYAVRWSTTDGKKLIYPTNDVGGVETEQISRDINHQIGVAFKEGLDPMASVRVNETSMQTSLSNLFDNANVAPVTWNQVIDLGP